jgi:hypothetical protein
VCPIKVKAGRSVFRGQRVLDGGPPKELGLYSGVMESQQSIKNKKELNMMSCIF